MKTLSAFVFFAGVRNLRVQHLRARWNCDEQRTVHTLQRHAAHHLGLFTAERAHAVFVH